MKALDVVSTQLNFINLLDQAGYALSEIVVKRFSAAPAFNEGHANSTPKCNTRQIKQPVVVHQTRSAV
ncbi:hypothetical protein RZO81_27625, partial [Klebsiella quasipneumoniae subsp. similipneumoniae]|nr:hypothetical protein [Klebsiella quasipneumoniae subsp. similipneumoniae]